MLLLLLPVCIHRRVFVSQVLLVHLRATTFNGLFFTILRLLATLRTTKLYEINMNYHICSVSCTLQKFRCRLLQKPYAEQTTPHARHQRDADYSRASPSSCTKAYVSYTATKQQSHEFSDLHLSYNFHCFLPASYLTAKSAAEPCQTSVRTCWCTNRDYLCYASHCIHQSHRRSKIIDNYVAVPTAGLRFHATLAAKQRTHQKN